MSNINHLSFHLRKLEREEIIRIRAEIMKSRTGNQYRKQQNIKFEKKSINLMSLYPHYLGKKEIIQITKTRSERRDMTIDPMDIKRLEKKYLDQLYAHQV